MRDIKFRALDSDGEFIYGLPYKDTPNETAYYKEFNMRMCWFEGAAYCSKPFKNGTLQQYTGLKDKNGKKIYEGDIVDTHRFIEYLGEGMGVEEEEEENICEVVYVSANTQFGFFPVDKKEDRGYFEPLTFSDEGIEVIGNIHKDKELLKV